jgi:hypothetical protein
MSDPILRRIADHDAEELEACLHAIVELGDEAAGGIAALDFLPEAVMHALAGHALSDVRNALARNRACPSDVLSRLAVDPDEWVRYSAVRNPSASEQDRVAFALVSSPSEVERANQLKQEIPPESDPATPPEVLRNMAEEELSKEALHRDLHLRSALGANRALPEDVVDQLVQVAGYRWEWRSLWGRGDWICPSTYAFLSERAPEWLIVLLARHGHPAGLLHRGVTAVPSHLDPAAALRDLVNSELLVRALWRELALAGVVDLVYWNDSSEGDQFFPRANGLELMDSHSAAHHIVGGYSSTREWISNVDSLEEYSVFRLAAGGFEDWFDDHYDEAFDDDSLGLFALCGVAWISEMNYATVGWTPAGREALEDVLWDSMAQRADSDDFDTEVTVVSSRLPAIGYAETSDSQKAQLTELIRQSRRDSRVSTWGIADHFLMCIALHPATPQLIRDQLLMDSSEDVGEAARLALAAHSET